MNVSCKYTHLAPERAGRGSCRVERDELRLRSSENCRRTRAMSSFSVRSNTRGTPNRIHRLVQTIQGECCFGTSKAHPKL